jgi:RNA polymerase sigma-70 factor, ECF subfamily
MGQHDDQNERDAEPTDLALVARWKAGDERAATTLVARHAPAMARYVTSLGGNEIVDEVVQDAFVRAFESLGAFRGDSSLRTWLFTIVRRLMIDRRRAERRQAGRTSLEEGHAATEYGALDRLVAVETESRVRAAIDRLTTTQREVFTLRVAEGLSYREIAEVVGTTEGAARVHYHNAVRAVKEFVNE